MVNVFNFRILLIFQAIVLLCAWIHNMGGGTEVLLSPFHPICLEVNGLELLWIEMKINALTYFL